MRTTTKRPQAWQGATWGFVAAGAILELLVAQAAVAVIVIFFETCDERVTHAEVVHGLLGLGVVTLVFLTPWIAAALGSAYRWRFVAFALLGSAPLWVALVRGMDPSYWSGCLFTF